MTHRTAACFTTSDRVVTLVAYPFHVVKHTGKRPLDDTLVFRPTFVPPWPTPSHMTPLTLNRLERPQVEAMSRRLARGKALPLEVVQRIVTKTDGVPLL